MGSNWGQFISERKTTGQASCTLLQLSKEGTQKRKWESQAFCNVYQRNLAKQPHCERQKWYFKERMGKSNESQKSKETMCLGRHLFSTWTNEKESTWKRKRLKRESFNVFHSCYEFQTYCFHAIGFNICLIKNVDLYFGYCSFWQCTSFSKSDGFDGLEFTLYKLFEIIDTVLSHAEFPHWICPFLSLSLCHSINLRTILSRSSITVVLNLLNSVML